MKLIALLTVFALQLTSLTTYARQYTQCSTNDSSLYSVINLETPTEGTLFLTLGTETDTHSLGQIYFLENKNGLNIYTVTGMVFEGTLSVPENLYGSKSETVQSILYAGHDTYVFNCFTRFYND